MSNNPASAAANLHHTGTYYSEEDFLDENFPLGVADPDYTGYPGEPISELAQRTLVDEKVGLGEVPSF